MNLYHFFFFVLLVSFSCKSNSKPGKITLLSEDEIIETYLRNGAWKNHYLSKEWDYWIDKAIQQDSTIAYLWQQKALPYWKQKKYSQAIYYYEKALDLNPKEWQSRLAYLKCIFAKDYSGSLKDLKEYMDKYGSTYEQDHALELYQGINYLQLDQFKKALQILKTNVLSQEKLYGKKGVHYLDRYYLAVALFELEQYELSKMELDLVLNEYPRFSDALFYKSYCLHYLGNSSLSKEIAKIGKSNYDEGFSFNEDSSLYENYPYQITWQWNFIESILN